MIDLSAKEAPSWAEPDCQGSRATNPHRCCSSPRTTTPEETMYTLGIDVHKDESHVIVLDDDDEIHDEVRVLDANLDQITKEYAGAEAAIEATSNYFTIYDTLDETIDELENLIEERAASPPETQLVMSIPGVSFFSSLLLTSELGEIDRFDEDKEVVSYAGLDPVVRESADSRTEGGISKRGNPQLRSVLEQHRQCPLRLHASTIQQGSENHSVYVR